MKILISIIISLIITQCLKGQNDGLLIIKSKDSGLPIKNVNVIIPNQDTVLISDTSGIVNLKGIPNYDSLIIKKFGYYSKTTDKNTRQIELTKDQKAYSHNLKLLDLKHRDGFSFIKLKINGEDFWFRQNIGYLYLGNGKELENYQDYIDIFRNYKIIKTVSVATDYCLWKIRGENYANWIEAIYYNPMVKKRKADYIPGNTWTNKHQARKDGRKLKLINGCLD